MAGALLLAPIALVSAASAQTVGYTPTEPGAVAPDYMGTAPAANDVHVTAINPAGAPVNPAEVDATIDNPARRIAPLTIPLRRLGPGHYLSPGFTIPFKGTWRVTAHVRFDQFTEVTLAGYLIIS